MLNKTSLLIGILFLCILGAAKIAEATVNSGTIKASADSPLCTIAVVFENGNNTIGKNVCNNFTVSINIYNPPEGIGFYSIGIQWDPSVLELQHNNAFTDVVEGPWMKAFGGTLFPGPSIPGTNLTGGYMKEIPDGFLSGGPATGNGTMFTIAFHAKAETITPGSIGIMAPNTISYLLNEPMDAAVNIDATVNGSITIVIPEFSASVLLPLFAVATTIAIAAATVSSRKRRIPNSIS